jgi:two-component system chemotaxis response regulator CheB
MPQIRVLIIDDSVLIRRYLSESLVRDPLIDVVGKASSGRIGVARLAQVSPDAVALDVDLPDMNGIATLREIRQTHPRLPVIMLCTANQQSLARGREAIVAGASDLAVKPDNAYGNPLAVQRLNDELVAKLKALCAESRSGDPLPRTATLAETRIAEGAAARARSIAGASAAHGAEPQPLRSRPLGAGAILRTPCAQGASAARPARLTSFAPADSERFAPIRRASAAATTGVLAIGVSTGGPTALTNVLSELPASFALPVVIAQHMPPVFTRLLAERLSLRCPIPVREAHGGEPLRPGEAWIAPGDHHLVVEHGTDGLVVQLNQDPPENCCRPSVDVLFRSVAGVCGEDAIAVVLTGMGHDGLDGCRWIKQKRGRVIAQDQETSVVWGMPGSVARAGIADHVLPIQLIASELLRMTDTGVGARVARVVGAKT